MTDPIRLSKRLIELVGCSRREAELFIEGGWVTVDGEVIDEPQFKVGEQKVELDKDAKDARRAAILECNPDGTGSRVFAGGLRNPVGAAFEPTDAA